MVDERFKRVIKLEVKVSVFSPLLTERLFYVTIHPFAPLLRVLASSSRNQVYHELLREGMVSLRVPS